MKIVDKNYPHPVMDRRRDDIAPFSLDWNIDIRNDKTNYYFDYVFEVKNQTIESLIADNKVCFVVHVECSSTFFRRAYKIFPQERFEGTITVDGDYLIGRVDISVFVCSDAKVAGYQPEGMHSDYEGFKFELGKGDFVAVGDTHTESFYKDYDPIKKVSSMIEFIKDEENKTGPVTVELGSNKIRALIPKKLYMKYIDIQEDPSKTNTISTMLVLPVLMEGLLFLKENIENEEEMSALRNQRWLRSVEKKLIDLRFNIKENSVYTAAQMLLQMPYERASRELKDLSVITGDVL